MTPRLRVDLIALAVLPHLAVECNGPAVYEKFLQEEYSELPNEDVAGWVTERLSELAVAFATAGIDSAGVA